MVVLKQNDVSKIMLIFKSSVWLQYVSNEFELVLQSIIHKF